MNGRGSLPNVQAESIPRGRKIMEIDKVSIRSARNSRDDSSPESQRLPGVIRSWIWHLSHFFFIFPSTRQVEILTSTRPCLYPSPQCSGGLRKSGALGLSRDLRDAKWNNEWEAKIGRCLTVARRHQVPYCPCGSSTWITRITSSTLSRTSTKPFSS